MNFIHTPFSRCWAQPSSTRACCHSKIFRICFAMLAAWSVLWMFLMLAVCDKLANGMPTNCPILGSVSYVSNIDRVAVCRRSSSSDICGTISQTFVDAAQLNILFLQDFLYTFSIFKDLLPRSNPILASDRLRWCWKYQTGHNKLNIEKQSG